MADYTFVTLVDRAMTGGCELIHDGVRVPFAPKQIERTVPQTLALWLLAAPRTIAVNGVPASSWVHTRDGQYVSRFAVKDPTDELIAELGGDLADSSPIDLDTNRREGWDTDSVDFDRGQTRVLEMRRRPEDFQNVGETAGTFGKER